MTDTVNQKPYPASGLKSTKTAIKPVLLNGFNGQNNSSYKRFVNYPADYQPDFNGDAWGASEPSDNNAMIQHLARKHPSSPEVSLPVFVVELKDLPRMIFEDGLRLLSPERAAKIRQSVYRGSRRTGPKGPRGGTASAEYYFGWEPLFRDLIKMISFTEAVDKRVKELNTLYDKGLRVSTVSGSFHRTKTSNQYLQTALGVSISGVVTTDTTIKKWASNQWHPDTSNGTGNQLKPSPEEIRDQAWRAVHGWRLSPADAWELMPWSWMIDWFVPIGDLLEAGANTIPAFSTQQCVMRKTVITEVARRAPGSGNSWCTVTGGQSTLIEMLRTLVPAPFPTIRMPFLSGRQLAILASIGLSKGQAH
jgi:hypothetical protein